MNQYLFTPGPVAVTAEVSLSQARPLIGHRGKTFSELFTRIEEKLSRLLKSEGRTVIFPAAGTGGLECLAANFIRPGTEVLSISCGVFGDRFREIAALYGANVTSVDVPLGEGVTPALAADAMEANPKCAVLLLTQNETSTGVVNPIREIAAALPREKRPLVLVDGVSSTGAMPCYPQEWGVDGLATASQKGLLTPPGLALVWLSDRGWEAAARSRCPSYYFDLVSQRKVLYKDTPENPYTPPVSLYYALETALDAILSEDGPEGWFARRARAARAFAAGLETLGCELLVKDPKFRSPGVTAFSPPGGDAPAVSKALRAMGVEPAGGQANLKGKIIRMAHYGDFNWPEISLALGSLYAAMGDARKGAGDFMARACDVWMEG